MQSLHFVLLLLQYMTSSNAWVKEMENVDLYEGDIVLTPEQYEEIKTGRLQYGSLRNRDRLWPKKYGQAVVPYVVHQSLMHSRRLLSELKYAIGQYHKYTCIKLVERTDEKSYIEFRNGTGCSSPLGRKCYDGKCDHHNIIKLGEGCWWRTIIMHEIAHSLGINHEHTRPDRDQHVKILLNNTNPKMVYNFEKRPKNEIDSLGTKYDYLSMMHYGWNAFGKDKKSMTIKTLDPRFQYLIGQNDGFSEIDVIQINKLYRCSGNYPTIPPYVMPPEGCYDIAASCAYKSHNNYCIYSLWKRFMMKSCRKSCGYCGKQPLSTKTPVTSSSKTTNHNGGSPSPPCVDRVTDCGHIGKHRCTDPRSSWRKYMAKSCRRFCELC